jgi:hypothetical protein
MARGHRLAEHLLEAERGPVEASIRNDLPMAGHEIRPDAFSIRALNGLPSSLLVSSRKSGGPPGRKIARQPSE